MDIDEESSEEEAASSTATVIRATDSKATGLKEATIRGTAKAATELKEPTERCPQDVALHKELDTELLATNQKILNLLKKLDSMASQLEIGQYQKRYIELHQQLISKNKDLKKLYALFNSLDSVRHYLTKEINLLESIMSNLDLTTNSPTNRYEFLRQFEEIISKIQGVRDDVVTRLGILKNRFNLLNSEYASLSD